MPLIEEIREKIEAEQFEFSKHAVDQSIMLVLRCKKSEKSLAPLK
jgi:hypothetical protein